MYFAQFVLITIYKCLHKKDFVFNSMKITNNRTNDSNSKREQEKKNLFKSTKQTLKDIFFVILYLYYAKPLAILTKIIST